MQQKTEKTVLITGATSGIGRAFACYFAARGWRLLLAGRSMEKLRQLDQELKAPCRLLRAELSQEEACCRLLEEIEGERIRLFINNAGFGTAGPFLETDLNREVAMLKVNDLAMLILFKGVLKKMQAAGQGMIVNVASSAGLLPGGPYMAAYYASKAYVTSLTRGVARELKEAGSPVKVFALCPGPVNTNFNRNAEVDFSLKSISAETCVAACVKGMKKGQTIIIPSLDMRAAYFGQRFLPVESLLRITGSRQKRKIWGDSRLKEKE